MTRETITNRLRDGERQVTIEDIYELLHEFMGVKKEKTS